MNKGLAALYAHSNELSAKEQGIANYIIENQQQVSQATITQLAKVTKSSVGTIFRLCEKIGLEGFTELKYLLAVGNNPTEAMPVYENLSPSDSVGQVLSGIFSRHMEGLQATLQMIDEVQLATAIDKLAAAQQIEFWGSGGSAALALDAYHKFIKTGINVACHMDSHFQSMSASLLGTGSVVVAISHSGTNKRLVELVSLARARGAFVVAMSSYVNSPLSEASDITLATPTSEIKVNSEAMSSRLATLAMIDVVSVAVSLRHHDKVSENLYNIRAGIAKHRMT